MDPPEEDSKECLLTDKDVLLKREEFTPEVTLDTHARATLFSSGVNLLKSIIGAGILSLPLGMAAFGYVTGSFLMILAAVASWLGIYYYVVCASAVGRTSSPQEVAKLTYPSVGIILDVAIILKCLGVALAYLLLIGEIMSTFYKGIILTEGLNPSDSINQLLSDPRAWILLFLVIVVPLSALKRIDQLKYTSFLGLMAVVYLTLLAMVNVFVSPIAPSEDIYAFRSPDFKDLGRFGAFAFAFTCHQNVFPIYNELRDNSVFNMSALGFICIVISFMIYEVYGVFSYINYANVLAEKSMFYYYSTENVAFQIARILFALLLAFSYPLLALPIRQSAQRLLPLHPEVQLRYANLIHLLLTAFILVFTVGATMFQPDISNVIGLIGTMTSSVVCYIVPSIFYLKLTQGKPWRIARISAVALCTFGLFVFIFGTIASILNFLK